MSNIEKGFIPITEAQSERVRFHVSLPEFVDDDKIGVNLRAINRLCQIGGIRRLVVIGAEDLDTSKAVPQILGFNSQGSAYMGKAATKTDEPTSKSISATGQEEWWSHPQQWANTVIAINMNEVRERIAQEKDWNEGIRSTKAWSHFLNKGIKEGISREGSLQLLSLRNKLSLGIFASFVALKSFEIGPIPMLNDYNPHIPALKDLAITYFVWSNSWNTYDRFTRGKRPFLSDNNTRYTLFYGPEVDRAILLNIVSRTRTLVKHIEVDKK